MEVTRSFRYILTELKGYTNIWRKQIKKLKYFLGWSLLPQIICHQRQDKSFFSYLSLGSCLRSHNEKRKDKKLLYTVCDIGNSKEGESLICEMEQPMGYGQYYY